VDVDACLGEVRESARVVEVEVGEDDVGHVAYVVTEFADLMDSGQGQIEAGSHQRTEEGAEALGFGDVGGTEAGVDEYECAAPLDEQAVTDEGCAGAQGSKRAHRRAVEVVNGHGGGPSLADPRKVGGPMRGGVHRHLCLRRAGCAKVPNECGGTVSYTRVLTS
jgi:hypothetical protein